MRIRNKLTYQFAIIVATILLLFSFAIYFFSANYREQEFDKRLIEKGLTTARLLIKVDEVDLKLLRIIDRNNLTALQNEKITIYDSLFNKLYSSDDDPEIPISAELFREIKDHKEVYFNHGQNEVVGLLAKERNGQFFVIVSAYDKFGINKLKNLRLILISGFLLSVGVILLMGWIFSGQALKPISNIVTKVKDISANNLHSRIGEGNGQDELAQLAIQFNQMLGRLEQSFEMQKNFVSNASHELRTPLSTIRTQLEITQSSERDANEYKKVIESILEDINSLIKLSNGLLDLAQAGFNMTNTILKKIRVDELLYQCISDISRKYSNQKVTLNMEGGLEDEQLFIISGNEPLLRTSFYNLLDNACKYSDEKDVIATISIISQEIVISIIDQGVGIKQGEIPHIFDPFYRGSNVRNIGGHGIGLSLSKRIVELHQGKIELLSKPNLGTQVIIHLPIVV
jgi:signal transduction histidine kinase